MTLDIPLKRFSQVFSRVFYHFTGFSRQKILVVDNKDGVWNGVLTCVFVEVAESYEKKKTKKTFNLTVSWDGV